MSEAQQSLSDSIDHLHPSTARIVDFWPTLFWGFLLCRCSTHIFPKKKEVSPFLDIPIVFSKSDRICSVLGTCFVLMKTQKGGVGRFPKLAENQGRLSATTKFAALRTIMKGEFPTISERLSEHKHGMWAAAAGDPDHDKILLSHLLNLLIQYTCHWTVVYVIMSNHPTHR